MDKIPISPLLRLMLSQYALRGANDMQIDEDQGSQPPATNLTPRPSLSIPLAQPGHKRPRQELKDSADLLPNNTTNVLTKDVISTELQTYVTKLQPEMKKSVRKFKSLLKEVSQAQKVVQKFEELDGRNPYTLTIKKKIFLPKALAAEQKDIEVFIANAQLEITSKIANARKKHLYLLKEQRKRFISTEAQRIATLLTYVDSELTDAILPLIKTKLQLIIDQTAFEYSLDVKKKELKQQEELQRQREAEEKLDADPLPPMSAHVAQAISKSQVTILNEVKKTLSKDYNLKPIKKGRDTSSKAQARHKSQKPGTHKSNPGKGRKPESKKSAKKHLKSGNRSKNPRNNKNPRNSKYHGKDKNGRSK